MKLGIIGHGFVGSAVDQGFTRGCAKFIVDPKHNNNSIQDLIAFQPMATFICVPTPQTGSGEANTEIIESVLIELNRYRDHLVIVKSTVPAYKLKEFTERFDSINIIYNPEFLTEKNYIEDFRNPPMHVFGGDRKHTEQVEQIYKEHSVCSKCPVFHTDIVTASFVKYTINSFLATKVTFFNELYDVYQSQGGRNYAELIRMIGTDKRIGKTHMNVPGHNGERGYGGSCFPKDTAALAHYAREILGTPFTQLETSIKINDQLRKNKS
jgi:nucleotide sugar dehydrogenase